MNPQDAPYKIRWASPEDWQPTIEMVWKTFMKYVAVDYSEEGIQNFKDFLQDGRIYQMFLHGAYLVMIALDGDRVIGVITVRNRNLISLLFVDEKYHHLGVGSTLIRKMGEYLKNSRSEVFVSVKSSPYAIGFYRSMGFHECSPEQEFAGIRVTDMERFL